MGVLGLNRGGYSSIIDNSYPIFPPVSRLEAVLVPCQMALITGHSPQRSTSVSIVHLTFPLSFTALYKKEMLHTSFDEVTILTLQSRDYIQVITVLIIKINEEN